MTGTAEEPRAGSDRAAVTLVDCDIHIRPSSPAALDAHLDERWRRHRQAFGERAPAGIVYPRAMPAASRVDSWPPGGGPPASDLAFFREQHLDHWGFDYGVLNPLLAGGVLNLEFRAALSRAVNDWQVAEWLEPEPRLRASVVLAYDDGELAAEEIHRRAGDPRFVQVLLHARTAEPLGRRRYWPLYAAAAECGLPVGIHFGGHSGNPITGAGFPSFYVEDHGGMSTAFQDQLISLVCEGVFERFPDLRLVLIEGGCAWLPPLMWRLDRAWKLLREEVPHVRRLPSETIREHVWLTTQPIEEPPRDEDFAELLEELAMDDRLMFATDYPHWDFDAPDRALPRVLDDRRRRLLLGENAVSLYGLGAR
jgi:predicted TIM-barrel fold metal-dependent hydrolase